MIAEVRLQTHKAEDKSTYNKHPKNTY